MPKLYELAEDLETAYQLLRESVDEETGEINPNVLKLLNECNESFENKVEGIAELIRRFEIDFKAYASEEARMKKKKLGVDNAAKRLNAYLKETMEKLGKKNVQTLRYNVSICDNSISSLNILNIDDIPKKYKIKTVSIKLDNDAIRRTIADGKIVPGAKLVKGTHLRIS